MRHTISNSLDILIWGGVATPEAASAFLATGAAGIVFESVHWLTDLVAIDDRQRQRLSRLHLDSTDLAGLDLRFLVACSIKATLWHSRRSRRSRTRFAAQRSRRKAAAPS